MRRRLWVQGAGSLLALGGLAGGVGTVLPASAHGDDDGDFLILQARYGTERNHVDVTERLRELARQDRRFQLTNGLFGVDPDPGRQKTLRLFVRDRQGQERSFDYRERDWVDGAQFIGWGGGRWGEANGPRGWFGHERREDRREDRRDDGRDDGQFTILYATYGTGRREVDVTGRLKELARRDQRFRLRNDLFGVDPDPGQTKVLRIVARDRSGQERGFEYPEYATVDGAQFIGWRGGDWGAGPVRPAGGRLMIESASYGNGNRWVDVTQVVRSQVRGDRLDAEVRNELFGVDPTPGQRKMLTLTYRWGGSPAATVRVHEGDAVHVP